MRQVSPFQYDVVKGEKIGLHITPYGIPSSVTALLDGQSISPSQQNKFSFTVTKDVGLIHILALFFNFPSNSPPNALYRIGVTGSRGGTDSFLIAQVSPVHDPVLVFKVKKGDTGPK